MNKDNLDKNTIRAMVCNLRDRGMTYQAISDLLRDKYGVVRSRQAIQKMYMRSQGLDNKLLSDDEIAIVTHVCSLFCLGYNMTNVTNILIGQGFDITYQKVIKIVKEREDYINSIENTMLARLDEGFDVIDNSKSLKSMFEYRGVSITDEKFNWLIKEVVASRIKNYSIDMINRAFIITKNKDTAKKLCDIVESVSMKDITRNIGKQ